MEVEGEGKVNAVHTQRRRASSLAVRRLLLSSPLLSVSPSSAEVIDRQLDRLFFFSSGICLLINGGGGRAGEGPPPPASSVGTGASAVAASGVLLT